MTTLSLRLALALSIAASSLALDVPAGAQLVGGRSAFDARPGLEFVQFGDFWGDRRSSNRGDLLRILLRDCARPTDPRSVIKAIDPCLIVGVRLGLGLSLELMIRGEADDLASRGRS